MWSASAAIEGQSRNQQHHVSITEDGTVYKVWTVEGGVRRRPLDHGCTVRVDNYCGNFSKRLPRLSAVGYESQTNTDKRGKRRLGGQKRTAQVGWAKRVLGQSLT